MKRVGFSWFAALVAAAYPATANAQAAGDKAWIEASGYWPSISSDVQASGNGGAELGTNIDAETDLGLDENKVLPAVHAGLRIGRNWQVNAEYYALKRNSRISLAKDIIFEDVTFPVSAEIRTGFDTSIYRLTVGRTLFRAKDLNIGAAIGVHATDVGVSLEGQGRVRSSQPQLQRRSETFLAPLPTVGLFAHFEPMPKVLVSSYLDYLSLSVGDYDGRLVNARASVTYRFIRNAGVGLGYRYVNYHIDVDKDRYSGEFRYRFWGPEAFVQLAF